MSKDNGLFLALENADNIIGDEVSTEEQAQTAVEVSNDAAEILEASAEVQNDGSKIETALDATDDLGEIATVAADAVESGEGLDEVSAELASIAIERIRNDLGLRSEMRLVPATESFGNKNTRLTSTRLVFESVTETMVKIWKAVKSFAVSVWEKVKALYVRIFGSTKQLKAHLENLREKAQKANGKKEKETIDNKSLASAFSIEGKADLGTVETIIDNGTGLMNTADRPVRAAATYASSIAGWLSKPTLDGYGKHFTKNGAAVTEAFKVIATGMDLRGGDAVAKDFKSKHNLATSFAAGPFVGGEYLVMGEKKSAADAGDDANTIGNMHFGFETKKGAATTIAAPSAEDLVKLLTKAIAIVGTTKGFQDIQKESEKVIAGVQKLADGAILLVNKIAKDDNGKTDATVQKSLNAAKADANALNRLVSSYSVKVAAIGFRTGQRVADYASAGLANLKTETK